MQTLEFADFLVENSGSFLVPFHFLATLAKFFDVLVLG